MRGEATRCCHIPWRRTSFPASSPTRTLYDIYFLQIMMAGAAMSSGRVERPCYRPGKDILVPPTNTEEPETTRYLNPELDKLRSKHIILFGGSITGHDNGIDLMDPDRPHLDLGALPGIDAY